MGFLVPSGNAPGQSRRMSAVTEFRSTLPHPKTEWHSWFENAPVGLAQCRREGTVTALNPALEQMLKQMFEEFSGSANLERSLCLADLIHSGDHIETERLLRALFNGDRETFQIDSSPMSANRRVRWTAWHVPSQNGEPDCVLAMAQHVQGNDAAASDSPRIREAEQRLKQAEKLETVGRLAGGVAHDFNNLLTGVLLYCDLLLAHLEPCHRVRKYAEEIRNAGLQATGLVKQLLMVARPSSSEPRLLSLNEIAEGMRQLLVRLIGENIELQFRLDPNLGLVNMDPTQAQQILLNLVLNARDAMPGGGQIRVETSNCKVQAVAESPSGPGSTAVLPCALFVVSDGGSGMDALTRAHVFEAFFTTKTAGKGTGLGLSTVYDIVTRNGGLIHMDSAPACGTRVTVLLPLVAIAAMNSQSENNLYAANQDPLPAKEREKE
jgi:signal transduction histidine kinase